jgi:hypothetical protein
MLAQMELNTVLLVAAPAQKHVTAFTANHEGCSSKLLNLPEEFWQSRDKPGVPDSVWPMTSRYLTCEPE